MQAKQRTGVTGDARKGRDLWTPERQWDKGTTGAGMAAASPGGHQKPVQGRDGTDISHDSQVVGIAGLTFAGSRAILKKIRKTHLSANVIRAKNEQRAKSAMKKVERNASR